MSYQAFIVSLKNIRKHPNADRLLLADALNCQIIVGLDSKDGDKGIYFPCDGRLSEEFATKNDLIRRKDADGKPAGGMFGDNRKVRIQKFRGEISNGFWCPISFLEFLLNKKELVKLEEGFAFDTINGTRICEKYITVATQRAANSKSKSKNRSETPTFPCHIDTKQLKYFVDQIPKGSILTITGKLHGTSQRIGNVLDVIELTKVKKWVNKIYPLFKEKQEYKYLNGTRRVILNYKKKNEKGYYSDDFRDKAIQPFIDKLHPGEIIYFEVCGYESIGKPIMQVVDTKCLQDKDFTIKYGEKMTYDYGCKDGENKVFIYRIGYSMPDGYIIDLSWDDVKKRAAQLGVLTVPEIIPPFIYDGDSQKLLELCKEHSIGTDFIGSHWREGVVVAIQSNLNWNAYKLKNDYFLMMEGVIKDNDTQVDIEESA